MPKESDMTQLSRPYQIVLAVLLAFAALWFLALRGHSTSSGGGGSSPSATAVSAPTPASPASPAAPSSVYHGSAPGVEGLTRAIAKAHGAVAASEQQAKRLQEKSAQASGSAGAAGTSTAASAPRSAAKSTGSAKTHPAAVPRAPTHANTSANAGTPVTGPNRTPANQALVEDELKQGDVVVLLFWNPKGADDVAVHRELQLLVAVHHSIAPLRKIPVVKRLLKAVGLDLGGKIAVNEAQVSQVASFGSITRAVQVNQTPTMVIVNKQGHATTLTGLSDAFSIQQAIDEVRHS
jgi:hypothetical protein